MTERKLTRRQKLLLAVFRTVRHNRLNGAEVAKALLGCTDYWRTALPFGSDTITLRDLDRGPEGYCYDGVLIVAGEEYAEWLLDLARRAWGPSEVAVYHYGQKGEEVPFWPWADQISFAIMPGEVAIRLWWD